MTPFTYGMYMAAVTGVNCSTVSPKAEQCNFHCYYMCNTKCVIKEIENGTLVNYKCLDVPMSKIGFLNNFEIPHSIFTCVTDILQAFALYISIQFMVMNIPAAILKIQLNEIFKNNVKPEK